MSELEHAKRVAEQLGITPSEWHRFYLAIKRLENHDPATFNHSLRVGIYAGSLALDEEFSYRRLCFYGGCGHDVGKCAVPLANLYAQPFTDEDLEVVRTHPTAGFHLLRRDFLFSSYVAGLHHSLQDDGYGIDLEREWLFPLRPATERALIDATAIVHVCDFFDALTTRRNDKGLVNDPNDSDEVLTVMTDLEFSYSQVAFLIALRKTL
jgi:HD-GYP domain-containing protein (c-di-GMP phosphodiesterase class II)